MKNLNSQEEMFAVYGIWPFFYGKELLKQENHHIISLQELAKLRMQEGLDSIVCKKQFWVSEGVVYIDKQGVFLTKQSPLMNPTDEAIKNIMPYGEKSLYGLNDEEIEIALTDSIKLADLPNGIRFHESECSSSIPVDTFGENPITNFIFGEYAQDYGKFLREAGVSEMSIHSSDHWIKNIPLFFSISREKQSYASQLQLGNIDFSIEPRFNHQSALNLNYANHFHPSYILGVKDEKTERITNKMFCHIWNRIPENKTKKLLSSYEREAFSL